MSLEQIKACCCTWMLTNRVVSRLMVPGDDSVVADAPLDPRAVASAPVSMAMLLPFEHEEEEVPPLSCICIAAAGGG